MILSLLVTIFKQSSSSGVGLLWKGVKDKALDSFLEEVSQPRWSACPVQESRPPIEYLAPFFREWAVAHATYVATQDEPLWEKESSSDNLYLSWRDSRLRSKALESVMKSLSTSNGAQQRSQGPSPALEALLLDYTVLLQTSREQGHDILALTQQKSAIEAIEESRRGVLSADSVRR